MEATPPVDGRELATRLARMGERLAELLQQMLERSGVSADEARALLQEIATAMEELRVAEEELVVQAEQIAASQLTIDAERERYAELFEFAPDAYLETDGFGKILEANGAAEALLGVPLRFLGGKLIQSFVSRDDLRDLRRLLEDVKASPAAVTGEVELVPRDLPSVAVEARLASHFDPVAGRTGEARVRWLLRDVTERRKLDREIRQLQVDVQLLAALADLNQLVEESPEPVGPMLEGLVALAGRAAGGAEAGITVTDEKGRVVARAASSESAHELCQLQIDDGGPAMEVLREGRARADEVAGIGPWPKLEAALVRQGVEWVLSQPVPVQSGGAPAVFTLYGRGPREGVEHAIELLADHAAGVIANGRLYRSATDLAGHLGTALESRGVIEQAKGILMAWQGCDAERAFDILRRASQRENRKLRVVAEEIVAKAAKAGDAPT